MKDNMKDIFSDLYDRVLSFFINQNHEDQTKSVAKNRLRTVLMQDRVGFSERAMQMLKDDMLDTISRYLEIDPNIFNLSIDASENATILNLSIPVLRPKTDDEIDEAISIAQKQKIEKTQEIVGEIQELVKEKAQELAQNLTENEKKMSEDEDPDNINEAIEELDVDIKEKQDVLDDETNDEDDNDNETDDETDIKKDNEQANDNNKKLNKTNKNSKK